MGSNLTQNIRVVLIREAAAMSHILALVVALGSFGLYMSAFFLPEVYRKNDFIWSGVGMFYALVLWVCAGRITGGVLLGQMACVALLGWMGWQLVESRRLLTPYDQQTRLPGSSRNLGDLLKLAAEELPSRLQTQFKALPQQASGWVNQVTKRVGKPPKLAGKTVRSLPTASSKASPSPAPAEPSATEAPAVAPSARQPRPRVQPAPPSQPSTQAPLTAPPVAGQNPQGERSPAPAPDVAPSSPDLAETPEGSASAPDLGSSGAVEPDFASGIIETAQNAPQTAAETAEGLVELPPEPEDMSPKIVPADKLRSLDVQPLPAQPAEDAWTFDWEIAQSEPPEQSDLPDAFPDAGAIARDWQAEFDDDFDDGFGNDFDDDSDHEPEAAAENAVIVSIERLNLSPPLAESVELLSDAAALPPQASEAEATEDLEPAKSEPAFADEDAEDNF
jgi:hypothetical protein